MKLFVTTNNNSRNEDGTPVPFDETLCFLKLAGFEEIDFNITAAMILEDNRASTCRSKIQKAKDAGIHVRYAHLSFNYPNKNSGFSWDEFHTATCRAIDMAVEAGPSKR